MSDGQTKPAQGVTVSFTKKLSGKPFISNCFPKAGVWVVVTSHPPFTWGCDPVGAEGQGLQSWVSDVGLPFGVSPLRDGKPAGPRMRSSGQGRSASSSGQPSHPNEGPVASKKRIVLLLLRWEAPCADTNPHWSALMSHLHETARLFSVALGLCRV